MGEYYLKRKIYHHIGIGLQVLAIVMLNMIGQMIRQNNGCICRAIFFELIANNIYTSILYPPDVKRRQYEREKVDIAQAIKQISGDSGVFEPDDVGQDMMNMLVNGEYCRSWGTDGWMLINETAGFGVTWSLQDTLTQVMGMGLFRGIGMWYIQNIYNVCKTSIVQEKKKKDQ